MEEYKVRMIKEYRDLNDKYEKLHKMLIKYDAGTLEFKPTCPIDLLRKQKAFMGNYLYCLEVRAEIEGINLKMAPEWKGDHGTNGKYSC
jgi:hypothetical protein